jgi:hypothetical protein
MLTPRSTAPKITTEGTPVPNAGAGAGFVFAAVNVVVRVWALAL